MADAELTLEETRAIAEALAEAQRAFDEMEAPKRRELGAGRLARAIVDSLREPLLVLDPALRVVSANPAFCRTFRLVPEAIEGRPLDALRAGPWSAPLVRRLLERAVRHRLPVESHEAEHEAADLGRRVMRLSAWPIPGREPTMLLLAMRDITGRKRAEAHQRLLLRELDHRMTNLLETVRALARRTLPADEATQAFLGRLAALTQGHRLLARGEGARAELRVLIEEELTPYRIAEAGRIDLAGEAVVLRPETAQTLGLVLHELATNAVKYGALGRSGGRLAIAWTVLRTEGAPRLRLTWTESGGPPVREPARRGFGSTLIERGVAYELDGTVSLDFRPEGFRGLIEFPLTEWVGRVEPPV